MTKVKSKTRASPQNISWSVDRMRVSTIVTVSSRLCQKERTNKAIVYQMEILTNPKNGKYSPGTKTSLSSAGSTRTII